MFFSQIGFLFHLLLYQTLWFTSKSSFYIKIFYVTHKTVLKFIMSSCFQSWHNVFGAFHIHFFSFPLSNTYAIMFLCEIFYWMYDLFNILWEANHLLPSHSHYVRTTIICMQVFSFFASCRESATLAKPHGQRHSWFSRNSKCCRSYFDVTKMFDFFFPHQLLTCSGVLQ